MHRCPGQESTANGQNQSLACPASHPPRHPPGTSGTAPHPPHTQTAMSSHTSAPPYPPPPADSPAAPAQTAAQYTCGTPPTLHRLPAKNSLNASLIVWSVSPRHQSRSAGARPATAIPQTRTPSDAVVVCCAFFSILLLLLLRRIVIMEPRAHLHVHHACPREPARHVFHANILHNRGQV
ncbi:hypothetical protein DL89DRAFT_127197 [Linderina pennispora]|uniref:Uncharacterized protein n=1 Tax=Linderina pennispora TaxID=61395 RepID=A0A1Y1WE69_9FUNG|nr:uncharacterized protein DL89DRAFT_127197 [Linderina pennispora]ORX71484.1 hypothetical protein DL89DRAFT_127197 [Linderina pennispora]